MRIRSVKYNNRKKIFEIKTSTKVFPFPYTKTDPPPTPGDPVKRLFVDEELGREGFTYELESGRAGTVHIEQVLEYNQGSQSSEGPFALPANSRSSKTDRREPIIQARDHPAAGYIGRSTLSTAGSDKLSQVCRPARFFASSSRV